MSTYGTVASGSDDKQPLFAAPSDAPAQEPIYQERTQTRTMVNEHTLWIVEEEGREEGTGYHRLLVCTCRSRPIS